MKDEILILLKDTLYKPLDEIEILQELEIPRKETGSFLAALDELESEGRVYRTKKKKYILPEKAGLVAGTLSRTKKGFGFVIPFYDKKGDIYIPSQLMGGALDGDMVMALILSNQVKPGGAGSREGEIKKVLKRGRNKFAGIYVGNGKFGFVTDTGCGEDIFISKSDQGRARDGDLVMVKITAWPEPGKRAEGKILSVLGDSTDPQANLKALIFQHDLKTEFPSEVLAEAERMDGEIPPEELSCRRDLRGKTIVTIDGATAKDLDDAVSLERLPSGNFLLGVHIADVSHYVQEGSPLDKEAIKRGTSVYFVDQVIPMLPERLSNGLCSLNPQVPRLTLSCEMEIDQKGDVVSHEIFESVIQSTERLIYTDVSDILEKQDSLLIEKYQHIYQDLLLMNELAEILREKRMKQGSVDFDFDEAFISVDERGVPLEIGIAERRIANRIIEEFMLQANRTVSEHFYWLDVPFVYRVHENPDPEKIEMLKAFIWNFGYRLKGSSDRIHPKAFNDILEEVKGKPEEHVISTLMLRSMKKAEYSPTADGHFGLGFQYYSHFTSPIRRYPDLLIHRIIKIILQGKWNQAQNDFYQQATEARSISSSQAERNAEKMERDAEKLKKAEYMSCHIGEEYDGIISGTANSGFFVELPNTVEGFINLSSLDDDYYHYDREGYRFIGERTKKSYALGDQLRIRVASVDISSREINFELI